MMHNDENMRDSNDVHMNLPNMGNPQQQHDLNSYNMNNNNDRSGLMPMGPFGNHYGIDSTAGSIAGTNTGIGNIGDLDNKSLTSTPSKISKFTYSEYPQIRPTNPLYQSTATIKTATSHISRASRNSRASTMNTVSKRQKYNPNMPRRINDWRWVGALAVLLFFPTGLIAIGLAIKAQTKFNDGFIDEAKKLNKRAFVMCIISFVIGTAWLLTVFFLVDKWPRTYG